jgi:SagB-type dehydrogenase family enzyme
MNEKYGDNFQNKSKYERGNLPKHYLDWQNKPPTYKTYDNPIKVIQLPKPPLKKNIDFWKVIINRQSNRKFTSVPLEPLELSRLLYGMSGITRDFPQFQFRTVPSAGGLYPIEIYPVINNIESYDQGVYHYNIKEHSLELLKSGDFRKEIMRACLDQKIAYNAAVNFVWTALLARSKWKYLQRAYRYIYLDAGHIGQNFYLVAEALGLGACTIGAIYDEELNRLLDIDGEEETSIYVGVAGNRVNKD